MPEIKRANKALTTRILDGEAKGSHTDRRAAFHNSGLVEPLRTLVDKVARHAYRVTDEDIAGAIASGLSEDQVFEIVVCAAVGEASRMYEAGLAALDTAVEAM